VTEAVTYVKIPLDRVGALIGPKGSVRKLIEETLQVTVEVNSETGDVEIRLKLEQQDPSAIFKTKNVVIAIGRGFAPDKAIRLTDDNILFEVIDLRDYIGRSKSAIERIEGRIIGRRGKIRATIEELTGADISVYGYTVSIIGEPIQFNVAKEAVSMLIEGCEHKTVYRFLYQKRRDIKKEEMQLWLEPLPTGIEEEE